MSYPIVDPSNNSMKLKPKAPIIFLEPSLQMIAGEMTAHQRVMLGKRYYRWAIQLFVSARVLRTGESRVVFLEPNLQCVAGSLSADERKIQAKKYYRWAIQLFVSARILRRDALPLPRRRVPNLPLKMAEMN